MTPKQLREWLFQNSQEDQWWIVLDAVMEDNKVTLGDIEDLLKSGQYGKAQVLHISQTKSTNPPWIEVELSASQIQQADSHPPATQEKTKNKAYLYIAACFGLAFIMGLLRRLNGIDNPSLGFTALLVPYLIGILGIRALTHGGFPVSKKIIIKGEAGVALGLLLIGAALCAAWIMGGADKDIKDRNVKLSETSIHVMA